MKTHLYLVRHAHSIYTKDELGRPLSEKGMKDAMRVTNRFKTETIHVVLSSPYKRAIQTVEGVADHFQKNILLVDAFKERTLAAHSIEDFDFAIEKLWKEEAFAFPGGESNIQAQKRGVKATEHVIKTYPGENIVIGTHGNIMVLIMKAYDPHYDLAFWKQLTMPAIYKLTFQDGEFVGIEHVPMT